MLRAEGHDQTARLLISAITSGQEFVALTDGDRARILAVLDDPPRALVELRAVLFGEAQLAARGPRADLTAGRGARSRRAPRYPPTFRASSSPRRSLGAVLLVVVGRLVALVLELGDVVGALVVFRHV